MPRPRFCPGTGYRSSWRRALAYLFGIAGMVVEAVVYAELYPIFKSTVLACKDFGRIGVAEVLGISPWFIIPVFWAGIIWMFFRFARKNF